MVTVPQVFHELSKMTGAALTAVMASKCESVWLFKNTYISEDFTFVHILVEINSGSPEELHLNCRGKI